MIRAGILGDVVVFNQLNESYHYQIINENQSILNQACLIGENELLICDNNNFARIFDVQNLSTPKFAFQENACVNMGAVMGKLMGLVCDQKHVSLIDLSSGKLISHLKGHEDYNFSIAFNAPFQMATGGQDMCCIVWDIRQYDYPFQQIASRVDAVYHLSYYNNLLFLGESKDFVRVYNQLEEYQEIDFFGSLTGMAFQQDRFFIGINIAQFQGILELEKIHGKSLMEL